MTSPLRQFQLTFTEKPDYLYAELTGDTITTGIIREYINEIVAKSEATGKYRILIYRDIPAVLSGGEVYFTVNESLDALAGKKIALVNPHEAIASDIDFGMTVGQNRGGNYRSFKTIAEAEAWLLKGA